MIYRVEVNMEDVKKYLDMANVKIHNETLVTLWITAEDPDAVCIRARDKICNDILGERKTTRVREALKYVSKGMKITKIRPSSKPRPT